MKKLLTKICDEPYRLFFPLGVFYGIAGVSHWLFYSFGVIKTYSGFYHSSIQIMTYMNCFVIGFLLTAMPRFTAAAHATAKEVLTFFLLSVGMFIFLARGRWVEAEICCLAWFVLLGRFGIVRIKKRKDTTNAPPAELVWIPLALLHGTTGLILLMSGQAKVLPVWALNVGKPMADQGFLLSIVVGIGGFLIPRLLGTHRIIESSQEPCILEEIAWTKRKSAFFHLIMGLGLFLSFWLEGFGRQPLAYGLRAFIVTAEFIKNSLLFRLPVVRSLFAHLLWTSVWMITLGLWLVAFFPDYRVALLHIVFIGGFSLMTFSVATMVILSHAGEGEKLQHPLWIFWVIIIGLAFSVLKRTAVVIFPDSYFRFLALASLLWLLVSVAWLCFVAPRILKIPQADEFERLHEEAKKRIAQLKSLKG